MKRPSFSVASGLGRSIAAICCMLVSSSVFAAYPDSCQIQFLAEDQPFPNVGTTSESTLITLTTTETTHTADLAANGAGMNSFLMYIRDRDCPVDITEVTVTDADGAKDILEWGPFEGATLSGTTFEWPSSAQAWAGFANVTSAIYPLNISAGATITVVGNVTPEEDPAEVAACADTSVLRFEDAFDGAVVTCLTDTYEWPTGAADWAGFGDTARGDQYPFEFPYGGTVTFNATTASEAVVAFQWENEPYPNNTVVERVRTTVTPDEGSRGAYSIDIPASSTTFNNMLLYIETRDVPVSVSAITVTPAAAPPPPPAPAAPATPVPALPFWALLGLAGLVGLFGFRRR